jgi:hypothetical protein
VGRVMAKFAAPLGFVIEPTPENKATVERALRNCEITEGADGTVGFTWETFQELFRRKPSERGWRMTIRLPVKQSVSRH